MENALPLLSIFISSSIDKNCGDKYARGQWKEGEPELLVLVNKPGELAAC